jgi:hypothetical protein
MVKFFLRLFTRIIIPFGIAALIFYFTKPSDEKCTTEAIKKMETINVRATANDFYIRDVVLFKAIKYKQPNDTVNLGYGALMMVRIRDSKLQNVSKP